MSSIGRSAGDNSEDILNSTVSNINNNSSREMLNASTQQAQELLNILEQIHNETDAINDGTNIDFHQSINQLQDMRNQISSIVNEVRQLSQNSVQFDTNAAVSEINKLKEALNGAFSRVQELTNQLGSTESFTNFNRMFTDVNSSISQFQQQISQAAASAERTLDGMQSSTQQAADNIRSNTRQINNDLGNIFNLNELSPQADYSVFANSLTKQFEDLKKAIDTGTSNLSDQFTVLRDLGEKTAGAAFDSTALMFEGLKNISAGSLEQLKSIFGPDFNGILKPDEISAKFNAFSKDIIDNVQKQQQDLLKTLTGSLPGNDFNMLSSDALEQIKGVYKNFDEVYKSVITLANSSAANLAIAADKGLDGAKDAMEQVKKRIAEIQQLRAGVQNDINNASVNVFRQNMQDVLDPNTSIGKDYNNQYVNQKLEQFSWFNSLSKQTEGIQSKALNLQDRLDYDPTVPMKNVASISTGVNVDKIIQDTSEIDKLLKTFEKDKKSVINEITAAYASKDEERINAAKKNLNALIEVSQAVNSRMIGVADSINVSRSDIKNVSEVKELISGLQGGLSTSKKYFRELYDAAKMFGMDPNALKDIEKMNAELSKTQTHFNNLGDSSKSLGNTIKSIASTAFAPLSWAGKAGSMLGVSGIPIGLSGIQQYIMGSSDYYKKQAVWEVDAMKAEVGMGDISNPAISHAMAQDRVNNKGMYYQRLTNGMIDFQDYNNAYTNLVKNVGGQIGADDTKTIRDLNQITENTFAGQKLYNISDQTMAEYTKTFYKDLRQDADDVSATFMKMSQAATTANIPVEQYMKIVTQLASSYRSLGLTGDNAMVVMDRFTSQGMNLQDAQAMTQTVGQATNKFADNEGMWLLSSALSGTMGGDMFSSLRMSQDRWNPDGTVKAGFGQMAAKQMDTMASTYGGLGGGNEDARWYFTNRFVKETLGATGMQGSQLTNALMKDDYTTFEKLLTELDKGENKKTVILEGQKELENALGTLSGHLSEAQKWEAILAAGQYNLALETKELRDTLLGTFKPALEKLILMTGDAVGALGDFVSGIANSKIGGGILGTAAEHPLLSLGALGALFGIGQVGVGAARGAGSGLFNRLTGKGGKTVTKAAEEAGDKAPGLLSRLTKGRGKVAGIAAGLGLLTAGAAYVGSKFGGKDKEESYTDKVLNDRMNNNTLSGTSKLEQDVTGIYDTLQKQVSNEAWTSSKQTSDIITGLYGSLAASAASGQTIPGQTSTGQMYNGVNGLLVAPGSTYVPSISDANMPGAGESLAKLATDVTATSLIGRALSGGKNKITAEAADAAIKAAEKATGKATSEVAEAGAKTAVKFSTKGLLGTAGASVIGDAIYNLWDPTKHLVKGDGMKEDWGRAAAGFGVDASFSLGGMSAGAAAGAGIGALFGGVGAVPGALIGGIAGFAIEEITDALTKDETGKGAISRFKDNLTKSITGYSEDEMEVKRLLKYDKADEFMASQIQTLGVNNEAAKIMVDALEKHADKIGKLNGENRYDWALMYASLKQQNPGMSDKDIVKELDSVFSEGNKELKDTLIKQINTDLATNTNKSIDEIKKTKEEIIANVTTMDKSKDAYKEGFDQSYEIDVKKKAKELGISVEDYKKALNNPNSPLHEKIKKIDNEIRDDAEDEGDKTLKAFNSETTKIKNLTTRMFGGLTNDYGVLSTYANKQGNKKLEEVFNIKEDLQKEFFSTQPFHIQKYLRGMTSEEENKDIESKYNTYTLKKNYENFLGNAYSIQAAKGVFTKELGEQKGNLYFQKYKDDLEGKPKKQYKDMGLFEKTVEKDYQETIKKLKNKIDANASNTINEENKFQQDFTNKLNDTIKTGNTDLLRQLYNSNDLTGQSKDILNLINGNIQKLQEKGVVAGASTPLSMPSTEAKSEWEGFYNKNVDPVGYDKYLKASASYSAKTGNGMPAQIAQTLDEYKIMTEFEAKRNAFIKDPNAPEKKFKGNDIVLETDPRVKYGELSGTRESSNNIALIHPDGGTSIAYGKYQINSQQSMGGDNGFMEYLKGIDPQGYKSYFANKGFESQGFKDAWALYAKDKPELFETMQDNFAIRNYYDPAAKYTTSQGIDLDKHSDALKNVIWQLSNNLGSGGYQQTLGRVKNASTLSDKDLIAQLYAEAAKQPDKAGNKEWYEASKNIAYEMLGREGYVDSSHPGTGTDTGAGLGTDPMTMFGTTTAQFAEQNKSINTPFTQGTLLYGALPKGFNSSSYMTGDAKDNFSHLKTVQSLLNAGGAQEVFSMNSQSISKSLRNNLDQMRKNSAKNAGQEYYDNFTAEVSPGKESSIYRTGSVYNTAENKLSKVAEEMKDNNKAVIGMNVTTNQNIDAKKLAQIIQKALQAEGIEASIDEIKADIAALTKSLSKSVNNQNTAKKAQY